MRIDLKVPGFEGREFYVDYSAWGGARIILDGKEPPQGHEREFSLKRNDGTVAVGKFQGFLLDPGTKLSIDGNVIQVLPSLHWAQWIWAALPLVLLMGGPVGGAIGALAFFVNTRILRSESPAHSRYLQSALITAGVIIACIFFGFVPGFGPAKPEVIADAGGPSQTPTPQLVGTTALGIGRSMVHVDNDSSDATELQIDSERWGVLEPYAIEPIELGQGKHEFRFLRGSTEVDRIQAQLKEGKATIINPRGNARYIIGTYTYTAAGPFPTVDPNFSDVRTARIVEADFGLLDALPDSVQLKKAPGLLPAQYQGQVETRTKVTKEPPPREMSSERAMSMIESSAAYRPADVKLAFEALAQRPPRPEIRAILLECAESSNDQLAGLALNSLKAYADGISEERLLTWLKSERPTLVFGSARILMRRNNGALLRTNFAQLKSSGQEAVVRAVSEGLKADERPSSSLRRFLLGSALKIWPLDEAAKLSVQISDESLHLDEEFIKQVDAFVGGLKSDQQKKLWNSAWWKKLSREAPKMKNDWISGRLLEITQKPKEEMLKDVRDDAIRALIERNEAGKLAPVFGKLDLALRTQALSALDQRCAAEKTIKDSNLPLALAALSDPEPMNRRRAFRLLSQFTADRPGVEEAVRSAFASETDGNTKSEMEGQLTEMLLARLRNAAPEEQVRFVLTAPTQNLSAKALDKILLNADRAKSLRLIEQKFSSAAPVNRAWILADLGRFKRFYSDAGFAGPYDALVKKGLADADPSVRMSAVQAKAETVELFKGVSVDFATVFSAEAASPNAGELSKEYERMLAVRYGRTYRNDGYNTEMRKQAFNKLLSLAGSANESAAIAALEGMREVFELQAVTTLVGQFRANPSELRKVRILTAIGVNNDQAFAIIAPLYEKALSDPSPKVRAAAFGAVEKLCDRVDRRKLLAGAVKTASAKESDPKVKKKMEDWAKK